jgi:predicted dehydrogenase
LQKIVVAIPAGRREGPFPAEKVPPELDWEMWQGQAPAREYTPKRVHQTFRHWYDYSGGLVTDWGAHHNDIALWGTGYERSGPVSVEGTRLSEPIPGGYTAVADFRIVYTYANGVEQVCKSENYDNGWGQPVSEPPAGETHHGVKFIGTDGWIYVTRGKVEASDPELVKKELPAGAERLYASNSHFGNFVDCMRTRKPTICEPEVGHRSATVCHLGTISLRLNRKLRWDPQTQTFPDDKEAQAMVAREMRKPWTYEAV